MDSTLTFNLTCSVTIALFKPRLKSQFMKHVVTTLTERMRFFFIRHTIGTISKEINPRRPFYFVYPVFFFSALPHHTATLNYQKYVDTCFSNISSKIMGINMGSDHGNPFH